MSTVERLYAWLKSFRRMPVRYEGLATTYKGARERSMHNHPPKDGGEN
ncbi:MAG: hypothetical protein QW057_05115 [Candidatus Bathyarchaeia archaeon]